MILQFLFKLCSTPHNEVAESKASAVHASNFDGNIILTVLKRIGWFLVLNNLEDNVVSKAVFSSSEDTNQTSNQIRGTETDLLMA